MGGGVPSYMQVLRTNVAKRASPVFHFVILPRGMLLPNPPADGLGLHPLCGAAIIVALVERRSME